MMVIKYLNYIKDILKVQRFEVRRGRFFIATLIYVGFIYYVCFFSRKYNVATPLLDLFWSYGSGWRNGHAFPFVQKNLENIVLYIPVGFLICSWFIRRLDNNSVSNNSIYLFKNAQGLSFHWGIAVAISASIGFIICSTVEILQFKYNRGTFEVDDFFHNTLGTIIGSSWCSMSVNCDCRKYLWIITFVVAIVYVILFMRILYLIFYYNF